jgi:ribonuclease HI
LGRKKITQRNRIVGEILFSITQLNYKDCTIKIAWIPAHINISGNESADREAKKGRISSDLIVVELCRSEIKSAIGKIIDVEWRAAWDNQER